MSFENRGLYGFGRCRVDVGERHVLRDGEPVPISPKGFDLLVALVRRPGHLVSKELLS
jgi:DNA-binding winged helix-turn-helix (wHTH) protein